MTKIPVDRELLENLAAELESVTGADSMDRAILRD